MAPQSRRVPVSRRFPRFTSGRHSGGKCMSNENYDVLIVIPCLNEELHVERVVRHVITHPPASSFLLVIADGGSTDQTPFIAQRLAEQFPQVKYLHNPKRLQSAAVN